MKPEERENMIYSQGKRVKISIEEKYLLNKLPKHKKIKILDVGCGTGEISEIFKKKGYEVTGIDFSQVAIDLAKEKIDSAICVDVDSQGLPFDDESFDIIWMGDIIEHVFDPMNLFKEVRRVLKKDGEVYCTVPNDFNLFAKLRILLLGESVQSRIYEQIGISKHHTFFSYNLLLFFARKFKFKFKFCDSLIAPYVLKNKIVKSKIIGKYFGTLFIFVLKK